MKVLILKPSSLGDVVQALPVLRCIKRHLPESEVWWWIEAALAPLLEDDPELAGVIRFDRRRWAAPRNWGKLWGDVRWMRAQRFDWVIDLQSLLRSGVFAWLANGALTIGMDEPREGARGFYDRVALRQSFHTHAVDWYLSVLPLLGLPAELPARWLPERPAIAAQVRAKWPVSSSARWVLLQPGARWDNKRWPIESFIELAQRLTARRPEVRLAVLGGNSDVPLGARLSQAVPRLLDLTGRTSLPEMVEWIRLSRLLVTNDTGPMHIAAALGTPVVALFGPTDPRRTGPYRQLRNVLQLDLPCVPCLKSRCHAAKKLECLTALPVSSAFEAVLASP